MRRKPGHFTDVTLGSVLSVEISKIHFLVDTQTVGTENMFLGMSVRHLIYRKKNTVDVSRYTNSTTFTLLLVYGSCEVAPQLRK